MLVSETSLCQVVGAATLVVEEKFIHGCGAVGRLKLNFPGPRYYVEVSQFPYELIKDDHVEPGKDFCYYLRHVLLE